MADANVTGLPVLAHKQGHWTEDRIEVASQATHQIEAILCSLRRESQRDETIFLELLTSQLVRLKDLNSVAMSLLDGDHQRETREMQQVVFGWWPGEES